MKPGLIRISRSARRYQAPSGEMVLTCHICGSSDLRPAYDLGAFAVVSCDACGHGLTIHTAPPADTQERFQGHRWTETRGLMEAATSAMARVRYAELKEFHPGRDLLEVGCGTGEFLMAARSAGHQVVGLDLSAEAVDYVRERHPNLDVRCDTLDSVTLPPESVDVVAAFHVLEHVPDPIGLLKQMREVLRAGGLVYIRVPNLDTWYRRVLGPNWWGFSVEHLAHFTSDSISMAFATASLDVLAVRSGDSDPANSLWPVLPLLLGRSAALRSVGSALQPRSDSTSRFPMNEKSRITLKRHIIGAYLGYRRSASVALAPLTRAQLRKGGGPELVIVGRKTAG